MLKTIELKSIKPNPFNARKDYEEEPIELLAEEIEEAGFWSGALRGRLKDGKVELCFGHRRLEALKKLGYKEVKVDVVSLTDDEMSWQGLAENLQRQGLNDMEKAEGIKTLLQQTIAEKNISQEKACAIVGKRLGYKSGDAIRTFLPIAELTKPSKKAVRERKISGRAAAAAFKLGGDAMVQTAIEKKLTVHPIENLSRALDKISDEKIKNAVKKKVIEGKITKPEEIEKQAASMIVSKATRTKEAPDMMIVIARWTDNIDAWIEAIDEMMPYRQFMNTVPPVADKFRQKAKELVVKLGQLIKEADKIERMVN